jgi:hypothetical protein
MTDDSPKFEDYNDLPFPETKAELLGRMAVAYQAAEAFFTSLDESDRTRPLSDSGWSATDYLAHLMVWEYSLVALLEKVPRYKAMGLEKEHIVSGDFDLQNDVIYRQQKDRPFEEILSAFRGTHSRLLNLLNDLNDEDLQKPYIHYQPDAEKIKPGDYVNNPIMDWLVGDTYSHYAEHIIDLRQLVQTNE